MLGFLTSCSRKSSSQVDEKNDDAEISDPLIDFLQGKWILGTKDRLEKANTSKYMLFEGSKLTFSSEEDKVVSTFKIIESKNQITNHFYVEFSYQNLLTEDDPFSKEKKGSVMTEIDSVTLIKHSSDCIEVDPERGKAPSAYYYREKGKK